MPHAQPLPMYRVLITATTPIDDIIWRALWRHLTGLTVSLARSSPDAAAPPRSPRSPASPAHGFPVVPLRPEPREPVLDVSPAEPPIAETPNPPAVSYPPCPYPGGPPVQCGLLTREMAETRAFVMHQALRRHGYGVVPVVLRVEN